MTVNATVLPQLYGAKGEKFTLTSGASIAEMLSDVADMPGLVIYLNGEDVPKQCWGWVKPKPGTELTALVPVHGGGGEDGKKSTLALIATIIVIIASAYVGGGGLG